MLRLYVVFSKIFITFFFFFFFNFSSKDAEVGGLRPERRFMVVVKVNMKSVGVKKKEDLCKTYKSHAFNGQNGQENFLLFFSNKKMIFNLLFFCLTIPNSKPIWNIFFYTIMVSENNDLWQHCLFRGLELFLNVLKG